MLGEALSSSAADMLCVQRSKAAATNLMDMNAGGSFEQQCSCEAKGCSEQATGDEEVEEAEGDCHRGLKCQAGVVSQFLSCMLSQ